LLEYRAELVNELADRAQRRAALAAIDHAARDLDHSQLLGQNRQDGLELLGRRALRNPVHSSSDARVHRAEQCGDALIRVAQALVLIRNGRQGLDQVGTPLWRAGEEIIGRQQPRIRIIQLSQSHRAVLGDGLATWAAELRERLGSRWSERIVRETWFVRCHHRY